MKEYKVDLSMYEGKVREVVSEAIQRHAFELGYEWLCGGKSLKPFSAILLFCYNGSIVHWSTKLDSWEQEISAADFLALTPEDVKDAPEEPELKPFDRVLMRDSDDSVWTAHLYSHREEYLTFSHRAIGGEGFKQCIPYEGNEHLLGTKEEPK